MKKFKKIVIAIIVLILCFSAGAYAAYTFQAGDVKYRKADGTVVSVESALNELYSQMSGNGNYTVYSQGDTVTLGGEKFYVLADSLSSDPRVTLIARSCLNNTNFKTQVADTVTHDSYECAFSSSNYWRSETRYPFNLNTYDAVRNDTASAVYRANNYAKLKGAISGRLLTKEEGDALKTKATSLGTDSNVYKMLWGKENTGKGYLFYWLGSADNTLNVWFAFGNIQSFNSAGFYGTFAGDDFLGVRPVLTVYKSQLS